MKGGATTQAASEIAACAVTGTVVVSLQNGVENIVRIKTVAPHNALTNVPLINELSDRNFRVVLSTLQREALSAMASERIFPAQLAAASPRAMTHILRLPNFIFKRIVPQNATHGFNG